jgi:hypothetical protein
MSESKEGSEGKGILNSIFLDGFEGPYETALGKLTIRFSRLHFLLEIFGWKVWKLDPTVGTTLTKDLQMKHLIEKLRQSVDLAMTEATDRKDFRSILQKAEKIAEERNELHSLWTFDHEKQSVTRFNRKRLTMKVVPSVEEINRLNRAITKLTVELHEFAERDSLEAPIVRALKKLQKP